jgi:cytoskeletal protein CcmA (bactofilin family)
MNRLIACLLCLLSISLHADEEEELVTLPRHAVHKGDYFAYGKGVEISGTVTGDLYVFGAQVYIDGRIEGDVMVAGGSVTLTGEAVQDVRVAAGQIMLSGDIGGNATLVGGNLELFPSSHIAGSLVALAGTADIGTEIGGNLRVNASNVRLSGAVEGNVSAFTGQLRLTPKASIGGQLEYWSNKLATIAPEAHIGETVHHPSVFYNLFQGSFFKRLKLGSRLATLLMNFCYSLIVGLILIRFFPQNIARAVAAIDRRPLYALLTGIVIVIVLPIAFLILLITILGAPFALTLLALNVIGLYTAKVITIFYVMSAILRKVDFRRHIRLYFLIGLTAYFVLVLIPVIGTLVSMAAALVGLGGIILGKMPQKQIELHSNK